MCCLAGEGSAVLLHVGLTVTQYHAFSLETEPQKFSLLWPSSLSYCLCLSLSLSLALVSRSLLKGPFRVER